MSQPMYEHLSTCVEWLDIPTSVPLPFLQTLVGCLISALHVAFTCLYSPDAIALRVADKVQENFPNACLLMVSGVHCCVCIASQWLPRITKLLLCQVNNSYEAKTSAQDIPLHGLVEEKRRHAVRYTVGIPLVSFTFVSVSFSLLLWFIFFQMCECELFCSRHSAIFSFPTCQFWVICKS